MDKVINDDDAMISTDEDEEVTPHIDPVDSSFPNDEEFDPYESGLNDFTFEDDNIGGDEDL